MVGSRSLILFVPRALREAAKVFGDASSLTTTGQPLTFSTRVIIVRTNYSTSEQVQRNLHRPDRFVFTQRARGCIALVDLVRFERLERSAAIERLERAS